MRLAQAADFVEVSLTSCTVTSMTGRFPGAATASGRLCVLLAVALAMTACRDADSSKPSSTSTSDGGEVATGEPFPDARCEANRAAGTVNYLSGFDFAATPTIVDVLMADEQGYFEDMCLDVEITPSFSTQNYAPVAGGQGQMASGGSFSEVLSYALRNDAGLRAVAVEGRAPIDVLITKPGIDELADLEGETIGVKEALQPSIAAMLANEGLVEGEDYETVPLQGFDPLTHIEIRSIAGFPGYRSNEPGQLERAGVDFEMFDPIDYDIPGSFGVLFTSDEFLNEHPTAAQDFLRASMKGLADAIDDPEAATAVAVERINGNGNPNFLSPEGEAFRWKTESALVEATPEAPAGVINVEALQTEVDAYAEVGAFPTEPVASEYVADVLTGVYDADGTVIWPST